MSTWGVDGLISRTPGPTLDPTATSFYQYDPSGNTAARLSSANAVRSMDSYTAFGAGQWRDATGMAISEPDPIGYAGQWGGYTDGETFGSVLMGHRYYAPSEGRFLTRDPIGYDGGMNQYAYAGDNPVNWSDPSGLDLNPDEEPGWFVMKQPFVSDAERQKVIDATQKCFLTKRGKQLLKILHGSPHKHDGFVVTIAIVHPAIVDPEI